MNREAFMAATRDLTAKQQCIFEQVLKRADIRPFFEVSRSDIGAYLQQKRLTPYDISLLDDLVKRRLLDAKERKRLPMLKHGKFLYSVPLDVWQLAKECRWQPDSKAAALVKSGGEGLTDDDL